MAADAKPKQLPYYKWFPRDHDNPAYRTLTPLARLCLRELYDAMWQSGYSFPNDDDAVCRWVGIRLDHWRNCKVQLLASKLLEINENRLTAPFINGAYLGVVKGHDQRVVAGTKSAVKRAESLLSEPTDVITDVPTVVHIFSDAQKIRRRKREEKEKNPPTPQGGDLLPDWIPRTEWDAFVEMRQKIRAPLTPRAITITVNELDRLRKIGHPPGAVLDQSTMKSWRGVFALSQPQAETQTDPLLEWERDHAAE